jgi:ribosomal protein S18 acetylase RimI-like enzyme
MDFVERRIFTKYSNVFLCVSSFNSIAQKFYKKLGYQIVGVLKNYLVEGHDEILMRKTTGPILEKQEVT